MSALTQENRVAALTQEIATHAQSKQLEEAKALFNTILREGLKPSSYTYSALINAHVNSGDLVGATRTLEEMVHGGFKANVIVLTTLLKVPTAPTSFYFRVLTAHAHVSAISRRATAQSAISRRRAS